MRRTMFWIGWSIFFLLPIAFVTEALITQNVPALPPWKWAIPAIAFLLIVMGRNRDDVLKHHVL